jgi:peptide/nickel transport system ATP-binding protein
MNTMWKIEELRKYFPVEKSFISRLFSRKTEYIKAVDDVSFSISKGEIFTLAGESGCGKTTTGMLLVRLTKPTSGKMYFEGRDVAPSKGKELRDLRKRVQIIFQDPYSSLNPRMRIGKAVSQPLEIHKLARGSEKKERTLEALTEVGLTPSERFFDLYPHQLSGGQRQRVAIARAIITRPTFVVADEPVSMIDVSIRTTIIDLMLGLRTKLGITYLFITHDLAVAKYISDRIAIMYLGKIVELCNKKELFLNPLHPYTKALLSAIPVPSPGISRKSIKLAGEVPSAIHLPTGCRFNPRCKYATEQCRMKEPALVDIEGHLVACYNAV